MRERVRYVDGAEDIAATAVLPAVRVPRLDD